MKRILEFITKANQLLFFLVMIAGLVGITLLLKSELTRSYQPPSVPVAQSAEVLKKTIVDDVKFLGETSGVYLFGIVRREVETDGNPSRRDKMESRGSWSYLDGDRGQMVNVIFSKGGQKVRTLLANNGLVISFQIPGKYQTDKLKVSTFLCITEDTDGNHVLDKNDRNDLYIVAEGLEKADIVVKGVMTHDRVSGAHLLVKIRDGESIQFYDYDTDTLAKTEVMWK